MLKRRLGVKVHKKNPFVFEISEQGALHVVYFSSQYIYIYIYIYMYMHIAFALSNAINSWINFHTLFLVVGKIQGHKSETILKFD